MLSKKIVFSFFIGILGLFIFNFVQYSEKEVKNIKVPIKQEYKPHVVVAVGDIACRGDKTTTGCKQKETSDLALSLNPDKVLALGDLQYPGGMSQDFLDFYDPTWGRLKSKTLPVPGNHDYLMSNAAGFQSYFKDFEFYNKSEPEKFFYSTDLGNWHLIALDSNCWNKYGCDKTSLQYKWLQEDLNQTSKPCVLAFMHHPLYSSGLYKGFDFVKPFRELLLEHKADLVLNGHDHIYEHFVKQDGNGQKLADGVRQFTVGTGGYALYSLSEGLPNTEFRQNTDFGVLKLTLGEKEYKWEFISISNQILDSGTENCN